MQLSHVQMRIWPLVIIPSPNDNPAPYGTIAYEGEYLLLGGGVIYSRGEVDN